MRITAVTTHILSSAFRYGNPAAAHGSGGLRRQASPTSDRPFSTAQRSLKTGDWLQEAAAPPALSV